jgi:hypothetical protein
MRSITAGSSIAAMIFRLPPHCGQRSISMSEFYVLHHMNTDAKENLYVTEVQDGKRAQKFAFKGFHTKEVTK